MTSPFGDGGVRRLSQAFGSAELALGRAHELDVQVRALVQPGHGGAGWSGAPAEAFASAWGPVSQVLEQLAGLCRYVAGVLGPLADALDGAYRRVERVDPALGPLFALGNPGQRAARGQKFSPEQLAQNAREAALNHLTGVAVPPGLEAVLSAAAQRAEGWAKSVAPLPVRVRPVQVRPWWERALDGAGHAIVGELAGVGGSLRGALESAGELVGLDRAPELWGGTPLWDGPPVLQSWEALGSSAAGMAHGFIDSAAEVLNQVNVLSGIAELPSFYGTIEGGNTRNIAELTSAERGLEPFLSAWGNLARLPQALDPALFYNHPRQAAGNWLKLLKGLTDWNDHNPAHQAGAQLFNVGSIFLGGGLVAGGKEMPDAIIAGEAWGGRGKAALSGGRGPGVADRPLAQELLNKRVKNIRPLVAPAGEAQYANRSYLVDFTDGTSAIYKPVAGEFRGSWKSALSIPWGHMAIREVSISVLDEELGLGVVPVTVMWHGPEGEGSLQLWKPGAQHWQPWDEYNPSFQEKMRIIHYGSGETDGHAGNVIAVADGWGWDIDNGRSAPISGIRPIKSDYVANGLMQPFSADALVQLNSKNLQDVYVRLRRAGLGRLAARGIVARLQEMQDAGMVTGKAWRGWIIDGARNVAQQGRWPWLWLWTGRPLG